MLKTVEICYIVRFFEENLRGRGDPWSLRQTAIYQSINCLDGSLAFVLVQPSSFLEKQLEQKLPLTAGNGPLGDLRYILLHGVVLSASLRNWQAYFESQAVELETVVRSDFTSRSPRHGLEILIWRLHRKKRRPFAKWMYRLRMTTNLGLPTDNSSRVFAGRC